MVASADALWQTVGALVAELRAGVCPAETEQQ